MIIYVIRLDIKALIALIQIFYIILLHIYILFYFLQFYY